MEVTTSKSRAKDSVRVLLEKYHRKMQPEKDQHTRQGRRRSSAAMTDPLLEVTLEFVLKDENRRDDPGGGLADYFECEIVSLPSSPSCFTAADTDDESLVGSAGSLNVSAISGASSADLCARTHSPARYV